MFDFNPLFSRQLQKNIWNLNINILRTWDFSNLEYAFWSLFEFQIIKTDIARIYIVYWRKKPVFNNNRKEFIVFTERNRDVASFYVTLQFWICFYVYRETHEHIQILHFLVGIFKGTYVSCQQIGDTQGYKECVPWLALEYFLVFCNFVSFLVHCSLLFGVQVMDFVTVVSLISL